LIQLPRRLAMFVLPEIIYASFHFRFRYGTEAATMWDWISAVPLSWGPNQDGPGRPVTLRRHLSTALPLSKSLRN
jgi:hypothetical protein